MAAVGAALLLIIIILSSVVEAALELNRLNQKSDLS